MQSRIIYSILFYVLLMTLILVSKPSIIFDRDGSLRPFGVGIEKSMFSFGVFTVVLAVVSFYTFCLIDLIFQNKAA